MGGKDHPIRPRHIFHQITEHLGVFGGIGVADRVGDVDRAGAGLDGGFDAAAQEVALGAGGVLGRPFDIAAQVAGVGHRRVNRVDHILRAHLQDVVAVLWAGGYEGVDAPALGGADRVGATLDIGDAGPGQPADRALGDDLRDLAHGFEVAVGGDRKARLDHVDAHVLEDLGQLYLLVDRHRGAGRLLAVTHGGVKHDDFFGFGRGFGAAVIGGDGRRGVDDVGHWGVGLFTNGLIRRAKRLSPERPGREALRESQRRPGATKPKGDENQHVARRDHGVRCSVLPPARQDLDPLERGRPRSGIIAAQA